jgi:hypothetical protein
MTNNPSDKPACEHEPAYRIMGKIHKCEKCGGQFQIEPNVQCPHGLWSQECAHCKPPQEPAGKIVYGDVELGPEYLDKKNAYVPFEMYEKLQAELDRMRLIYDADYLNVVRKERDALKNQLAVAKLFVYRHMPNKEYHELLDLLAKEALAPVGEGKS